MLLKINGLTLLPGEKEGLLLKKAAGLLGVAEEEVTDLKVLRRSLDARRARPPRFVYLVSVRVPDGTDIPSPPSVTITIGDAGQPANGLGPIKSPAGRSKSPAVVVGSGPAGLFAALTLARGGVPVVVLERGKAVPERVPDVRAFWEQGILDPNSNVQFGEGGAGTFSDGKLTTRLKNPAAAWVKNVLAEMGAPSAILTEAHPHIGTDRLRGVVINLRQRLLELGCEVRFQSTVTDFLVSGGKMQGIVVNGSQEIRTGLVILACGQSADDTYRRLLDRGVALEPKPFAIGLRCEHPQEVINRIQYGKWAGHPALPPAEYFLTAKVPDLDRAVYSFCMCPGGQVIGSSALPGTVVTNGMSYSRRDGNYANSAIVVNVRIEDLGRKEPLAGLRFRRRWETTAFAAGGGDYRAPAQRLTDFMAGGSPSAITSCSFLPAVAVADLKETLPQFVVEALKRGIQEFERKMPGFITAEATLIGVETRTSSPVRIVRGANGQSTTVTGLFPCGEGAGYAGGIISSALDGIRAAEFLIESLA